MQSITASARSVNARSNVRSAASVRPTSLRSRLPAPRGLFSGAQKQQQQQAPQVAVKALDNEILMLADGLETPVELFYVLSLVALLIIAGFFVVRQVLIRRSVPKPLYISSLRISRSTCQVFGAN